METRRSEAITKTAGNRRGRKGRKGSQDGPQRTPRKRRSQIKIKIKRETTKDTKEHKEEHCLIAQKKAEVLTGEYYTAAAALLRFTTYSSTKTEIKAAVGTATSAPRTPASAPPNTKAMITANGERSTVDFIMRGARKPLSI